MSPTPARTIIELGWRRVNCGFHSRYIDDGSAGFDLHADQRTVTSGLVTGLPRKLGYRKCLCGRDLNPCNEIYRGKYCRLDRTVESIFVGTGRPEFRFRRFD
jgi:hypothetical protein